MSSEDLNRDFGRLEGKVDAIVNGISELKDSVKEYARREQDARETLESALTDRIESLETKHKRLERLSWVVHGVWMALIGLFTLPASVKTALANLLKAQ